MTTVELHEWATKLEDGTLDVSDLNRLADLPLAAVLALLRKSHPYQFLHSRRKGREEIGLARGYRRRKGSSGTTQVFQDCLLLTAEAGRVTTWACLTSVKVRIPHKESDRITFVSGGGFSLYHDPDGWKIKLLQERTVQLQPETALQRGWLLEPERIPH